RSELDLAIVIFVQGEKVEAIEQCVAFQSAQDLELKVKDNVACFFKFEFEGDPDKFAILWRINEGQKGNSLFVLSCGATKQCRMPPERVVFLELGFPGPGKNEVGATVLPYDQ